VTPVKDREDGLRYLLNFAGISSFSYYLGLFLADLIIFTVPTILIFILSYVLQVETFTENAVANIVCIMTFGITYIPLAYIASFIFTKADSAFKYNVGLMGLYSGFFLALWGIFDGVFFLKLNYWLSPFWCLYSGIQLANSDSVSLAR
jgi:hypothetical protein